MVAIISMTIAALVAIAVGVVLFQVSRYARAGYYSLGKVQPRTFEHYRALSAGNWRRLAPPEASNFERAVRRAMDICSYGGHLSARDMGADPAFLAEGRVTAGGLGGVVGGGSVGGDDC
ncbi:MAG: hypothetical protein P8N02_02415 [Actinomycetota bacterium]|jgi:hypothetical protein|nr:hypothetical protein [Actinomycetota bacterium]